MSFSNVKSLQHLTTSLKLIHTVCSALYQSFITNCTSGREDILRMFLLLLNYILPVQVSAFCAQMNTAEAKPFFPLLGYTVICKNFLCTNQKSFSMAFLNSFCTGVLLLPASVPLTTQRPSAVLRNYWAKKPKRPSLQLGGIFIRCPSVVPHPGPRFLFYFIFFLGFEFSFNVISTELIYYLDRRLYVVQCLFCDCLSDLRVLLISALVSASTIFSPSSYFS